MNPDGVLSPKNPSLQPQRSPEQHSMAGFAAPAIDRLRIAMVGAGGRGRGFIGMLSRMEGVEITAFHDPNPDALAKAREQLGEAGKTPAREFSGPDGWKRVMDLNDIDLVWIASPWESHAPYSLAAMRSGKHVAVEVPAAVALEECWELVNVSESTRRHCHMLENCCYGEVELLMLSLTRQGLLGDLVHSECAYIHDLRDIKLGRDPKRPEYWRGAHSLKRNGNLYPTHGLGPASMCLGLNRGDAMEYLVSVSSAEFGLTAAAKEKYGADHPLAKAKWALGDMNTTIIRTALGRSIMVQHDCTSPRPYSRINLLSGVKGILSDYPLRAALAPDTHQWLPEAELAKLREERMHPLWRRMQAKALEEGGHGGMDYIMAARLVECLRQGLALDIDVYDTALWSAIGPLSEMSVANRGGTVDVPDFTRGEWMWREPIGLAC